MGQVLIRNIDDKVLERLKRRATTQQKSLEQSLRDVLTETDRPSRAELLGGGRPHRRNDASARGGQDLSDGRGARPRVAGFPVTLIVDASVALKWFLADEPYRAEAKAILDSGEPLIAPDLIIAETCNAAWRAVRVGRMRQDQAEEMARSLPGMFDSLIASPVLAERAIVVAGQLDPAVYDCFYLALAEARTTLLLVTADARFLAKLTGTSWARSARSLSDYGLPR